MAKVQFFITGTDTNVGKTTITAGLLYKFKQYGLSTAALKPIASGDACRETDTDILKNAITRTFAPEEITPFAFAPAIAPHIAASLQREELNVAKIVKACQSVLQSDTDVLLIEGCGGWLVPLNSTETMADLVKTLKLSVILVVGIRLGCLNHALLTYQHIGNMDIDVAGWVANIIDPEVTYCEQQINILQQYIAAPLVGIIPHQPLVKLTKIAAYLNIAALLKLT